MRAVTEANRPTILEEFRDTGLALRRVNDVLVTQFQVLGERASGTNLVRKLIEKNLALRHSGAMGWKHAAPRMGVIPADFLVVVAVRNAESWALSMHKRPWHLAPALQQNDFSTFIRSPWHGVVDRVSDFGDLHPDVRDTAKGQILQYDRHPITGLPFDSLFQMRNVKLAAHLGMLNRGSNLMLVKAETVQDDPEAFVARVSELLARPVKGDNFRGVTRRLGNRFKLSVDPAARGETPKEMSAEDRDFMRQALDLKLEEAIGYTYP